MAWDKGFNFRLTSGFVTDGTNETYVLDTNTYPTTRNGVTFGWSDIPGAADRDAGVDRRLAGIHYVSNSAQMIFRVDLPAVGDYDIRLANGDTGSAQGIQYLELRDGSTVFRTIDDTNGVAQDNYNDATGVNRTEANWPSQNAAESRTFVGTVLNIAFGKVTPYGDAHFITHLFISQVSAQFPTELFRLDKRTLLKKK